MRVAEQSGRRVPEDLVRDLLVAVGRLADRVVVPMALFALVAGDRERHDDAVADLQLALGLRPDFDHLAHGLVANDVAGLHAGHVAVVEMQVRAADCRARDLDDGVARMLDLRVGNGVAADIFRGMPDQCTHVQPPLANSPPTGRWWRGFPTGEVVSLWQLLGAPS